MYSVWYSMDMNACIMMRTYLQLVPVTSWDGVGLGWYRVRMGLGRVERGEEVCGVKSEEGVK